MHLPTRKQALRVLARLIFIVLDFFVLYFIYQTVKEIWDSEDFISSFFTSVIALYVCSAVWIIVEWIFTFLHKFTDHKSFSDGLVSLGVAPFTLLKNTLGHIIETLGYTVRMFFGDNSDYDDDYVPQRRPSGASAGAGRSSGTQSSSGAKPFASRMNEVAIRANGHILGNNFVTIYADHMRASCPLSGASRVTFTGTLRIEVENPTYEYLQSDVDEAGEQLMRKIERLIENVQADEDGDIDINLELKNEVKCV